MATMNKNTPVVAGMFPDRASAEQAYQDLSARGYGQKDVNLVMSDETRKRHFSGKDAVKTELGTKAAEGAGIGAGVGGALGAIAAAIAAVGTSIVLPGLGLVVAGPLAAALAGAGAGGAAGGLLGALVGWGIPEETVKHYEAGIKNGGILMGVKPRSSEDAQYFETRWNSKSAATAATAATAGTAGARMQDAGTIPVVEEQLEVGKRQVELGTVQVTSHVVEKPVSETVTLREEHASIERRPVNRPASEADLAAFKDETIEVRETAEKAVVSKQAHVVEEVVVGKEATSSTQQISDTVRKTVVDVERDGGTGLSNSSAYEDEFRKDYATRYAGTGGSYDDYATAYQYGTTLASDSRYGGRSWDEIEANARSDWEGRNPGSTWDNMKAAVRHGWEKVTGQRR
ncbi:YsnF/AvaK domain-containing protein [Noviherbaspirillum pedocola]|uniref:YsnF/AvaK domain-containing protein n=1 Tax=Noviherbaspirillum pedocola TaxID=2801341 RepID=UPI0022775A52|nr:YsnF/AvaK domain-containing protein [Noviherbaspirillum pedocola]